MNSPPQPNRVNSHTHVIFADESCYNRGRYRSIAAVSATSDRANEANFRIQKILNQRQVAEIKWSDVRTDHRRDCAIKVIRNALIESLRGGFRIDVLGWDIQDSRHQVRGRDDILNLERMYYHLCRNLMQRRWGNDAIWHIHPDENSALNWEKIRQTLHAKSLDSIGIRSVSNPQTGEQRRVFAYRKNYTIGGITPLVSQKHPLVQVADLFAGLMVYSKSGADAYDRWRVCYKAELSNEIRNDLPKITASEKARSALLNILGQWIGKFPLGCGLDREKGLYTLDPSSPVNFWWYRPQRVTDKAPIKPPSNHS
jgi:hypothetical protein